MLFLQANMAILISMRCASLRDLKISSSHAHDFVYEFATDGAARVGLHNG